MKELTLDQITPYITAVSYVRIAEGQERNNIVDITKLRKTEIARTYEIMIEPSQVMRMRGVARTLEDRVREHFGSEAIQAAHPDCNAVRKAQEDVHARIIEASASGELLTVCGQLADDVAAECQDRINLVGRK